MCPSTLASPAREPLTSWLLRAFRIREETWRQKAPTSSEGESRSSRAEGLRGKNIGQSLRELWGVGGRGWRLASVTRFGPGVEANTALGNWEHQIP